MSDHGLFSSHEGQQGAANGKFRGMFSKDNLYMALDGWMPARAPASRWTSVVNFPYSCMMCKVWH